MKLKIPFLTIVGILALLIGACFIVGCSSSDGNNPTPKPAVTNSGTPNDSGLPPDPGKAGRATIAGIDSDNNGVRDDVQRYIALTYPKSEKVRKALTQYAVATEKALIDAGDKEKSVKHFEDIFHTTECFAYIDITNDSNEYKKALDKLESVVLNTDKRNNAYFAYLKKAGSIIVPATPYLELVSKCKSKLDLHLN